MRLTKLIGGLMILLIISCQQDNERKIVSPLYFDLNHVINKQIVLLDSLQPSLAKTLIIDNKKEERIGKSINWEKELEIFKEADINSPKLRESFTIKDYQKNGKHYLEYLSKKINKKGVARLIIELNEQKQLQSVDCKILSDNWLYSFNRKLHLSFITKNRKPILSQFSVKNEEGLLFRKKSFSTLNATIIFSF